MKGNFRQIKSIINRNFFQYDQCLHPDFCKMKQPVYSNLKLANEVYDNFALSQNQLLFLINSVPIPCPRKESFTYRSSIYSDFPAHV